MTLTLRSVDFLRNEAAHNRNTESKKGYSDGTVEKTYTILVTVLNYYFKVRKEMKDEVREEYPELQYGHYSTHSGRDTYISLCVQNKASMTNILTWVGQSSYRIMDRYIKLTPESQKAEVNSVFTVPVKKDNYPTYF